MKIKKLQLKNVKCFEEYILDFTSDNEILNHAVLVGRNGTGKSTILKTIAELLVKMHAWRDRELMNIMKWNYFSDKDIYWDKDYLEVYVEFKLDNDEAEKIGREEFKVKYRYWKTESNRREAFYYPTKDKNEKRKYKELFYGFRELVQSGKALYFDAYRYMSSENPLGPNVQETAKSYYSLLQSNFDIYGKTTKRDLELKQWIINIDYMRLKKASNRYEVLYNHLVRAFDLLLHPLKFECINEEGEILFYDEVNKQSIAVDLLSDGFKSIFQIIIAVMRMLFENSNEDKLFYLNSGIVLIDEIDCHIHPRWQKSIMPSMTELFPNCQFIVTTHSPYIIESVQDYEIKRIGDKPIV